ncbi:sulfotransferase [Nitrosococcus halophilus Nc 4]|uniref:Sulfotransferase n=1 Tax=Nitrosococcus halophilus (strain Nc4) TaxID=472759 RepID=D5C0P4_NITHN|nr:sulfotransferase [Nitrosococcus halophilus]ADE16367.1 sulfotransferase [Nitrosococcus halophilus Nc 4]
MLPNFFVVGAQKSGTTSLHHYLRAHPEIYLPFQKESKFFVHERFYNRGIHYYEAEYFSGWDHELAVGEVDPEYMYIEQALERIIKHFNPSSLKLIFIFRNPVERAFSHYLMTYRRGLEPLTFEEAISAEPSRISQGIMSNIHYSYTNRGFYLRQVEKFLMYVDRSKMLFLLTEDLRENTLDCLKIIFNFLEVSQDFLPQNINKQFHKATAPRSMTLLRRIKGNGPEKKIIRLLIPKKKLRHKLRKKLLGFNQKNQHKMSLSDYMYQHLSELFLEENNRLSRFINRDLSHWNYIIKDGKENG